jgi:hypothetical protein
MTAGANTDKERLAPRTGHNLSYQCSSALWPGDPGASSPPPGPPAHARLASQVNLCHQSLLWDPDLRTRFTTALDVALFNRSRAYQSQSTANMVFYALPTDIAAYVHMQAAMRTSIPLREWATTWWSAWACSLGMCVWGQILGGAQEHEPPLNLWPVLLLSKLAPSCGAGEFPSSAKMCGVIACLC